MRSKWYKILVRELADKWQIPTFTLALLLGTLAVYHLLANQERKSIEECIQVSEQLFEKKDYDKSSRLALELLKEKEITPSQKKAVHLLLARFIHTTELPLERHNSKRLGQFFQFFNSAVEGRPLTREEHLMLVDVYVWENKYAKAVEHLRAVLDTNPPNRTVFLRQMVEMLPRTGKQHIQDEYMQRLDELLAQKDISEQDLVWALDIKTENLFRTGQFSQAVEALKKALPRIKDEKGKLQLQYSQALGLYYQKQNDQAEPMLRDILDQLNGRDELEAKVCLLLGQICLKDDRPEEASAFYDQVIDGHTFTDYHLGALVGKAEAESRLHRFTNAQQAYRNAFTLLEELGPNRLVNRDTILSSMAEVSLGLAKEELMPQALSFAYLERDFLDPQDDRGWQLLLTRIGSWHRKWAEKVTRRSANVELPDLVAQLKKDALEHYQKAGDNFLKLSQVPGVLDRTAAQMLWQAAQCYELGGNPEKSQAVLETFVKSWSFDPHFPEALFRLAKMYQSQNKMIQAEEYYKRLITEYTRTPYGQQSLINLAECYLVLGPSYHDKAEQILRDMVDDTSKQKQFRPDSVEFRSAVFLLGKLYYDKKDYEQCVSWLEEALERYPTHREGLEARFLIAQSYRKLSDKVQDLINQTSDKHLKAGLVDHRQENLRRAEDLYRQAILAFEKVSNLTPIEGTYLKLAYIYDADCLFALQDYDQAIKAYEKVIERFERTPLALDSYVQIVNAYQHMGQKGKIKAVLERMKWLLKQIPNEALGKPGSPFSRRDWEEWIDWNYRSGLIDIAPPSYLAQSPDSSPL